MDKNKLQQQIEEMEAKLTDMKAELNKPKFFKWEYKSGCTFQLFRSYVGNGYTVEDESLRHGRYRKTKANAERSLERNRVANRLEALVEQLDSEWVADWSNSKEDKCIILKDYGMGNAIYKYCIYGSKYSPSQVYMSKDTALKICEMLNNKEIEL